MSTYLIKYKWPVVILLILVMIVAVRQFWGRDASTAPDSNIQTVLVQKTAMQMQAQTLDLSGNVTAKNSTIISSKFGGKIKQIPVGNGDEVKAGQVLVLLDDSQQQNAVLAAKSAQEKAAANLDNASDLYQKMQFLYQEGAISENDYDQARLGYEVAKSDADAAAASLSNAEEALDDTSLTSDIDGLVANCSLTDGQAAAAGTPLMTVQDISSVYVVVKVNQESIGQIKPGLPAEISAVGFPDQKIQGQVDAVNPSADSMTRTFEVKITAENPGYLLKPGMYVQASISLGSPREVLAVPQTAVSGSEGLYYVFLADGSKAKRQPVEIGQPMGDLIEIKSGLTEGQMLIVSNVNKLNDGDPIRIAGNE